MGTPCGSFCSLPLTAAELWFRLHCITMMTNEFDTYPIHWVGMEPMGMHTIGMDTCGFVAGAPRSVLRRQDRMPAAVRSVPGPTSGPPWSGKRR